MLLNQYYTLNISNSYIYVLHIFQEYKFCLEGKLFLLLYIDNNSVNSSKAIDKLEIHMQCHSVF